jgi:hypothetical protein
MHLEVIVENEPALRLYEGLGFERVRELEVWSAPARDGAPPPDCVVSVAEAHDVIRRLRPHGEREPWQRDDHTLANLADEAIGLATGGGGAVVLEAGGVVSVLQLAGEPGAVRELLDAASGLGTSLRLINLPAGDLVGAALAELDGDVVVRQHEMVYGL